MKVYHGSCMEVTQPDILHSRKAVDFGPGFYVTPIYDQAGQWANKCIRRNKPAVVSIFTLQESLLESFQVIHFDKYSEEWLDFVLTCRSGRDESTYDVVIGGVANDKVFNTVELYFDGLIDKIEAIRRLQYEKPNLQICFRNQSVMDACLKYEGSDWIAGK